MAGPPSDSLRHHRPHVHLQGAFGHDRFGRLSETFARSFGTPTFLITQTLVVAVWITLNAVGLVYHWDPYPFILLNLVFSTQAAYAAPLILLAASRQAERDRAHTQADAEHREEIARRQAEMLEANTALTRQVEELAEEIRRLTEEIHRRVVGG